MNEQLKSYKTVEQIAKKHRMEVSDIQKQLDMGAPIEHEHTNNQKLAVEIALQHLDEIPDYYTRLKKMEADAKKEHKKFKDVTEGKGLWANIHARRKKGLSPKKPGEKGYPKTLDIEEGLQQTRKIEVPDCHSIKEETGMVRYCPKCKKDETQSECRYGTKFWAMYSTPSMLTTNQIKYDPNRPHPANEEKDHEYSMARSELSTIMNAARRLKKKMKGEGNIEAWVQSKITKAADYIDTAADYIDSGESKVNEDVTIEDANGNTFVQIIDIIKADRLVKEAKKMKGEDPCWKGYEMIGKKKKGGKEVPNCVPEQLSFEIGGGHKAAQKQAKIRNLATGTSNPNEKKVALGKLSGPSLPLANSYTPKSFAKFMAEASPAWQRKEGKNSEGGLNKKGIASYRKENPGSNLSLAVTTKPSELKKGSKSANRRKSFCSRMSGMKKKLTSAKTANDPNSRINKSLRKWNC